jgi:Asp-tRNA(Asn)/Glu-tRNA(Gln) amidotransferase A subunit family amidase
MAVPPLSDIAPTQSVSTTVGEDLCFMPATALSAAIRAKRVSPVELVNAVYARLHQINPRINAFCTLTEEQAHRAAKEAEAAVMRGDRLGALHGVPVSIKDLFLTRAVRTMYGSRIRENYIPEEDAPAVAKLLAAGAILIGKTTTPEFGFKGVTDSPLSGITRNPWDLSKTSGGSSGGAGAAVAAGLGPIAIGSDGGGSIRIPASFNGIFGLKPSLGRVANYPSSPVPFLVHAGPLTRTVHDAALLLNVIAGPDERDLLSLPADATDYLAACEGGVRGLRVAWSPTLGYAKVDPEVASVTEASAKVFESSLGCKVEAADPGFESPWSMFSVLWTMNYALQLRTLEFASTCVSILVEELACLGDKGRVRGELPRQVWIDANTSAVARPWRNRNRSLASSRRKTASGYAMTGAGSLPRNPAQNTFTGSADLSKANPGFEDAVSPAVPVLICLFPAQKPATKTIIEAKAIAAPVEESQPKLRRLSLSVS